jgi:hypothetical protein
MPEKDKQSGDEKGSNDTGGAKEAPNDSPSPVNETPPAPPDRTQTANYAESCDGIVVFVQAEGDRSNQEDE